MTLWLVRSGKYGEQEALALDKGVAVIGWDDLPDLSMPKRENLYAALAAAYPDAGALRVRHRGLGASGKI